MESAKQDFESKTDWSQQIDKKATNQNTLNEDNEDELRENSQQHNLRLKEYLDNFFQDNL